MSDGNLPVKIDDDEQVARFITQKGWVRSDGTIRQNAFMPPSDLQMSVTRKRGLSEEELWNIGQAVVDEIAQQNGKPLPGRADLGVNQVKQAKLSVSAFPLTNNPSHAHIEGWPPDKEAQKLTALMLAAAAGKMIARPPGSA